MISVLLLTGTVCAHGTISETEMNIGGINIGASLDYVEQIYRQPTKKSTVTYRNGVQYITYDYNALFSVNAYCTLNGFNGGTYVDGIVCREDNSSTPSGFAVGMPFKNVTAKYPKSRLMTNPQWVYGYRKDYAYYEYEYFAEMLIFAVDKHGIIKEIQCISNVSGE
jgi:hypothetical protein